MAKHCTKWLQVFTGLRPDEYYLVGIKVPTICCSSHFNIHAALKEVSPASRRVLIMHYLDGKTTGQIALSSGDFVGLVADNPDEKIKLKMFHAEIINDAEKLNTEASLYKDIPVVSNVTQARCSIIITR